MLGAGALALGAAGTIGYRLLGRQDDAGPLPALDLDFLANRFRLGEETFTSLDALFAATPGTGTAAGLTLGPHVAANAPELLTNGTFDTSLAGWTPALNGGSSAAAANGVAVLTSDAATGTGAGGAGITQSVTTMPGHAYRVTMKVADGTAGLRYGTTLYGAENGSGGNRAPGTHVDAFSASGTSGQLYFFRAPAGTSRLDDISVKPCEPFEGFAQGGLSFIVEGKTPSTASGNKPALSLFIPGGSHNATLRWQANAELHLLVVANGVPQCDLNLGLVPPSFPFRVAATLSENSFHAQLNSQPIISDTAGTMPGFSLLAVKANAIGESWTDGTIDRLRVYDQASFATLLNLSPRTTIYAAWGDSLTAGAGATGGSTGNANYPMVAAKLFQPTRTVVNLGLGSQTSTQIAARMNARPILVTVNGNQIPASGSVAVSDKNINVLTNSGLFIGTQTGTLAGIKGTISTDTSGNWTFTRKSTGDATPCPSGTQFICDLGEVLRTATSWLWLGRNGANSGYTVEDDIDAAIKHLGHDRYLVGSILTAATDSPAMLNNIVRVNDTLADRYGDRYVDVLGALRASGNGTQDDTADIAAGFVPRSLRSDSVHLNDQGYAATAAAFKAGNDRWSW